MNNTKTSSLLFLSSLLLLASCQKEELRVYNEPVPKPVNFMPNMGNMPMGANPHANVAGSSTNQDQDSNSPSSQNLYDFKKPESWTVSAGDQMRILSFASANQSDISVIKMPGQAGDLDPNLTRWAGQIGITLDPAKLSELKEKAIDIKRPDNLEGKLYDYGLFVENGTSILAAVFNEADGVLFVKAKGDKQNLIKDKDDFFLFNQSLNLKESK